MKSRTPGGSGTRRTAARRKTEADREIVPTGNGCPVTSFSPVRAERSDEDLLALRRARARQAIDRIRRGAKGKGLDKMTMKEIDALIAEVRRGSRERQEPRG